MAFGGLYFLAKRVWLHGVVALAIFFALGGWVWLLYAPFANRIIRAHNATSGWVEAGGVRTES